MFSTFRSYFERDMIELNSPYMVHQMRNIHRNGDQIGGEGRAKDDRVVASCIAVVAWNDWIMLEMQAGNRTWVLENRPDEQIKQNSPAERSVLNYLKQQGISLRKFGGG
jgi:hypothetical protein